MQKRALGDSGLMVASLCFGGNVFGWTIDQAQSFPLLDAFVERGFNFVDTADVYSTWGGPNNKGGESETIIGAWFKKSGKRDQVVLATKVGHDMTPEKRGLSAAHILRSVDESLQRLRTDYIDLYQSHKDDLTVAPDETLRAYQKLIEQGKVRAIGASNFTADRLKMSLQIADAAGLPRYCSLQPEYNLYDRAGFEQELGPLCLKENVGVISYYSLARGFLSGKYRSEADVNKSARGPRVAEVYFNDRGFRILAALDTVAAVHGSNPARIALAWLMSRPGITAPIASATTLPQLDDLMAAADVALTDGDIAKLDAASDYSTP